VREPAGDVLPDAHALQVRELRARLIEVVEHRVDRAAELGELVVAAQLDARIELAVGDLARRRDQRRDPPGDERRRPDPEARGGEPGDAEQDQERGAVAVGQRRADLRERARGVDRVLQVAEVVVDGGRDREGQAQRRAGGAERLIDDLVAPRSPGERGLGFGHDAAIGGDERDRAQAGLVW